MAKNSEMVSFDLPTELITEILSRLPVKYLLRLKSICKAWYALIENPNFVEIYCKNNPAITSILFTSTQYLYLNSEGCHKTIDLESPCFSILGICYGLVCVNISFPHPSFIICNPTTREFRQIPLPNFPGINKDITFFGFSLFSNEYKLVRVIYRTSIVGEVIVKAEMYAMSTDIWVEIDVKMADRDRGVTVDGWYHTHDIPVVLKEVFYWAHCSFNDSRVVSFNVNDGFYDEINVPYNLATLARDYKDCWRLIEFEEKLSLVCYRGNHGFEIWVLNEDTRSWTWKLSINNIPTLTESFEDFLETQISVVGYTKNGELLVEENYDDNHIKLILYDLSKREVKIFPCVDVQGAYNFNFYTESLLSVKLRNEVAEAV